MFHYYYITFFKNCTNGPKYSSQSFRPLFPVSVIVKCSENNVTLLTCLFISMSSSEHFFNFKLDSPLTYVLYCQQLLLALLNGWIIILG